MGSSIAWFSTKCVEWPVWLVFPDYLCVSCGSASTDKNYDMEELETIRNYFENPKVGMFFFNWDLLHARLNSHYKAWSYKKKKPIKFKKHAENLFRKNLQLKCVC